MADEEKIQETAVSPIEEMGKIMTGLGNEELVKEDLNEEDEDISEEKEPENDEPVVEEEEKEPENDEPVVEEEKEKDIKAGKADKAEISGKKADEEKKPEKAVERFWREHDYLEDDDFLTAKQQRELDAAREEDRRNEAVEAERNTITRKAVKGFEEISTELSAEKTGKGLDFKTVAKVGAENLSAKDWNDYARELKENPDPKAALKLFYNRCILRTPDLYELKKGSKPDNGNRDNGGTQKKTEQKNVEKDDDESLIGVRMKDILGANRDMVKAMFGAK